MLNHDMKKKEKEKKKRLKSLVIPQLPAKLQTQKFIHRICYISVEMPTKHNTATFSLHTFFLHFDFRFVLSEHQEQSRMTCGQTCLTHNGFPCGGCSKDTGKKYTGPILCQTDHHRPHEALHRLTAQVFLHSRSTVGMSPLKYPAERKSVPLNP